MQFNRDIRPILAENCFYCHGQDPNKRKAGLRLDVRDRATTAVESGEVAIVPGDAGKSELVARIFSDDADEQMPPPKSNRVLTAQQKADAQTLDRRGSEIRSPLGLHRAGSAGVAGGEGHEMVAQPDRSVRARQAGGRRI